MASPEAERASPPPKRPNTKAVKPKPAPPQANGEQRGQKRSRSRSRSRSPPRKRPGAGAAISAKNREAARQKAEQRQRQEEEKAKADAAARGVSDVVKSHYNAVPERGREWRKTESKIKGLRSFNNWVKSCLIQKFAPTEVEIGQVRAESLLVLDVGCGKGGDLQKWASTPQHVQLYVGCDPANVSINQARERHDQMRRRQRGRSRLFEAHFFAKDCFDEWIGDIPLIRQVGIEPEANVGPGARGPPMSRGGFDVVSMMFCMHYAFESEQKARRMLRGVAGALKKGGRFLGVIPNSDVLSAKVEEHMKKKNPAAAAPKEKPSDPDIFTFDSDDDDWNPEKSLDVPEPAAEGEASKEKEEEKEKEKEPEQPKKEEGEVEEDGLQWGNDIYTVKFPGNVPKDGVFRPPFGWRYFFFLEEAVGTVPEYVVPWEAFRALAEDYNLELQYRKPFNEVWDEEKDHPELGPLSERMGVRGRGRGPLLVSPEEMEATSFYHAFCFYKV